jgi:cytidylate kinase
VRARRRFAELQEKGSPQTFAQVLADMEARDRADSTRADSPLTDDGTYTRLDTSALSIEEVVDRILAAVGRPPQPPG